MGLRTIPREATAVSSRPGHWALLVSAIVLCATAGIARAADIDLNVVRAKLKSGTGAATGRIVAKGDFVLASSPGGAFTGTTSVDIRVTDAIGLDQSFSVPCAPASTSLKCLSDDPRVKLILKFGSPGPTAVAVRFKLRAVRLAIDAPFKEPVTVAITEQPTGTILEGSIVDCQQKNTVLKCREF